MTYLKTLETYLPPQKENTALNKQFAEFLAQSEQPILIDFYAEWCKPCIQMMPNLERLAAYKAAQITVIKVNVDNYLPLLEDYRIMGVPTFMLFNKGKMLWDIPGVCSMQELVERIDEELL